MYFLESENVGLRGLSEEDVEGNYIYWFNDPEVCRYNSHHRFVMSPKQLLEFVRGLNCTKEMMVLAVELKEQHIHIGNISLQNINYIDRNAEIAFMMGEKKYWNHGYAEEAAKLILKHGFEQLGLERVYFGTSEDNIGMQKLGNKLNFKKEGVRRKAMYKNGKYRDIYEYGLLKEESKGL